MRGEVFSPDHWHELFRMLKMPRGSTLESLTFGDILQASDSIVANMAGLKELHSRAQGEVSIREALRELELWGAAAEFSLTDYQDSANRDVKIIKDWKELVNQVGTYVCVCVCVYHAQTYLGVTPQHQLLILTFKVIFLSGCFSQLLILTFKVIFFESMMTKLIFILF